MHLTNDLYNLFFIFSILYHSIYTGSDTNHSEISRDITLIYLQTGILFWLVVLYILNPVRLWQKSERDMKKTKISAKMQSFVLGIQINLLKDDLSLTSLFALRLGSNIIFFSLLWGLMYYWGINIFGFFTQFLDVLESPEFPDTYKIALLGFAAISTVLLIIDKEQIFIFSLRIGKIFLVLVNLGLMFGVITASILALQLIFEACGYPIITYDLELHAGTVAVISFYLGMALSEYFMAREYLRLKKEETDPRPKRKSYRSRH